MLPGSDSMGMPSSFTARRPNASNLPNFELPPPQLPSLHQKYQHSYSTAQPTPPVSASLTSVGNLLTPPSIVSGDGLSPLSSGVTTGSTASSQTLPPYTPNGYMWPPPNTGSAPYGFHTGTTPGGLPFPSRGLFSPSLNSIVKGSNSPNAPDGLPPSSYGEMPPFQTSMSTSAPSNLPALPSQHHSMNPGMMGGQVPVTQSSLVGAHDTYARHPPTPSYYGAHPCATNQGGYSYSAGATPLHQSPLSAGGSMPRLSPSHSQGQVPSLQSHSSQSPYAQQRPFTYPMPGPVLSNVNNPNGQLALVQGMLYNSGHAAHIQQMYQHSQAQVNPQADRPFKCDVCPQSFNRNHDLKRHKRIHLAVKPFPCGHCDKSFSRKDALKRHILVKGCGKPHSSQDGDKMDSVSPEAQSEITESSPVLSMSAYTRDA